MGDQLKDYYSDNRFWHLFTRHKKWAEFYRYKEAWFSIAAAILASFICIRLSFIEADFGSKLQEALSVISGGQFTLLGFVIGSLAIVSGTLQTKLIKMVDQKNKAKPLMSILSNFYLAGAVLAGSIFFDIFSLLAYPWFLSLNYWFRLAGFFAFWYLVAFSVVYSTMLIGTSLRMFLLAYFYLNTSDEP